MSESRPDVGVSGSERRRSWKSSRGGGSRGANGQNNYGKISVIQLDLSVGQAASVYMSEPVSVS